VLIGTSRKSFIGKIIGSNNLDDRLEGTSATVAIGIMNGASIIRVHDVQHMKRVAKVVDAIINAE
jgi:dihydropteroate synthase